MKLDRLLAITMLLLNRKRVSAAELAERFEVSLRTVYRDLDTLNQAGIPIVSYSGSSGGYEIMENYRVERQFLTLEELQSIIVALKGIRSTFTDQDIGGLLDKVGTLVTKTGAGPDQDISQEMLIDLNPWQHGEADKEKLSALRTAIRQSQMVRFTYTGSQGELSERSCEPMGVVLKGYVWYLYGYCKLREDFRVFRLSRLENLELLPDFFTRRDKTLEQLHFRWSGREEMSTVRLRLHFQRRARARVQDYFRPEQIVTESDGTMLVTSLQPEEPWLYGMLLSFGPDVLVVEPESVARAVREQAEKIIRRYEGILT